MSLSKIFVKVIAVFALAVTSLLAAPPEGKIQINYHRPDGKYERWGVHLWKSPNMPLPDIEWPNPMMPTGTNEFGVYWVVDQEEFRTGSKMQVNYIIHKGDIKEQGAKDMAFNGLEHKEIWVFANDRSIFFSLDEVKKAHPELVLK